LDYYEQILDLFENDTEESFNSVAMNVFNYQANNNPSYKRYLKLINCQPGSIRSYKDIPLLPIGLFKSENIQTGAWTPQKIFRSSGTTNQRIRSKHRVRSLEWYNTISSRTFMSAGFGLENVEVLGLLPSYLENNASSLVHMAGHFQKSAGTAEPANFMSDFDALNDRITTVLTKTDKDIVLIGVTFALLDYGQAFRTDSDRLKVIFTGGMKRRRTELSISEIIAELRQCFPSSQLYSEYGMTEMLSQAYADDTGSTNCKPRKTGVLGLVDLANVDSLSFILTEDLSQNHSARTFEIHGRMDESDIRGCNLLYEQDYFV